MVELPKFNMFFKGHLEIVQDINAVLYLTLPCFKRLYSLLKLLLNLFIDYTIFFLHESLPHCKYFYYSTLGW